MKVTVVGSGNVGATVANVLATKGFASEVVLIDIKEGLSEGKAMDIMQTSHMLNFDTTVIGVTNDYAATAGSQVVVVTSGIPRKPGMTREQLIGPNAKIVKSVVDQILAYSPDAILIIVSNPMDAMTYLTLKDTKLPRNRIIGQGGMLDSSRFRYYLAEALKEAGYTEEDLPVALNDIWLECQMGKDAKGFNAMVKEILEKGRFDSIDKAQACMGAIVDYSNKVPKWILGGQSSDEVSSNKPDEQRLNASIIATAEKMASMYERASAFPKVGRNDPCPCGSGLKYKNCHGKNQS